MDKSDRAFLGYVGHPDLHDARVERVERRGAEASVHVRCVGDRRLVVEFAGVRDVLSVRSEGLVLYALAETACEPPGRRFVFVNWDEEDDARLEVVAETLSVRELAP